MSDQSSQQTVTLTIDGRQVVVARGTNLIQAANSIGIEIPHYCYHPCLSVAGNCRICQVEVAGQPKLVIACNTSAEEGMDVFTHATSHKVREAQAAVLEFILINHPLDCTVCDRSGHCKLQDYYFAYNARPSRFLEDKVQKSKVVPLGPTVMLDAERCIMCSRCVRFCDEITKTCELGIFNRGDRSELGIFPGRELNNPLSGSVVDLCPVGALSHRNWRFVSRIWFAAQTDTICPGCSTGCNVRVLVRDRKVVYVKARFNDAVNKEWLCDEGRYGFERFLPSRRFSECKLDGAGVEWDVALKSAAALRDERLIIFMAPDLLLEDYLLVKLFLDGITSPYEVVLAYRRRELDKVQQLLVSPDYAANFRAAEYVGLVAGDLEQGYDTALAKLKRGAFDRLLLVGDRAILGGDLDEQVISAAADTSLGVALLCDAAHPLATAVKIVLPSRPILEKSGLMINRAGRLQYGEALLTPCEGSRPEWWFFNALAALAGDAITDSADDRACTLFTLKKLAALRDISIRSIKEGGVQLSQGV